MKDIWIWGFGEAGELLYNIIGKDGHFRLKGIIDQNKATKTVGQYRILSFDEAKSELCVDDTVVICCSKKYEENIKEQLISVGMKNIKHFWDVDVSKKIFLPFLEGYEGKLISKVCSEDDFDTEWYKRISNELHSTTERKLRKDWEWVYIIYVLEQFGFLKQGKRGLGFAVGCEPLPSYFAGKGVDILATDLAITNSEAKGWQETNQNAGGDIERLYFDFLCNREQFYNKVNYRDVDMNDIPTDIGVYDFCWSSCAIEHVGSLEQSKRFLRNMIKCLKPGGIAIHTTEFNLTSNDSTVEYGDFVIYRKKDLEELKLWMEQQGHKMEISFLRNHSEGNDFVDIPPFSGEGKPYHINKTADGYAETSYAIVIHKSVFEKETSKNEGDRVIDFAKQNKNVYIYGAGTYGKRYFDFLKNAGIEIRGFIVSHKHQLNYCGKDIFEPSEIMNDGDTIGIIPAFSDVNVEELLKVFDDNVEIYHPKHLEFLEFITQKRVEPIIAELEKEFGRAVAFDEYNKDNISRILIVRTDAIGDLICTIPFIRELKKDYEKSQITVVVRKSNRLILENCPYIDELLFYDSELISGELYEQSDEFYEILNRVKLFADENFKGERFDAVFLPRELMAGRNIIDELLIALISGARIRFAHVINTDLMKNYIRNQFDGLFTHISFTDAPMHEVEYQLNILKDIGENVENSKMELWCSNQVDEEVVNRLHTNHNTSVIYIAVGLVASVPTRTWSIENYIELFEKSANLYGTDVKFLIMGGNDAVIEYNKVNIELPNVINFTGKTSLEETIAIIKNCNLYIGSNTGLLHIASASSIPSITIYAELDDGIPTDGDHPVKMGAWGVKHTNLIPPSGLDGCHRVCRMGYPHCINQIRPEKVFEEMQNYIAI